MKSRHSGPQDETFVEGIPITNVSFTGKKTVKLV